jgi:hypothetical protein
MKGFGLLAKGKNIDHYTRYKNLDQIELCKAREKNNILRPALLFISAVH